MNVTDLPQACISLIENVPGIDFIDEDFAIFDNIDDIPSLDHPMRIDAVVFALCTKGFMRIRINMEEYVVGENHLVLSLPDQIIQHVERSEDVAGIFIVISKNFIEEIIPHIQNTLPRSLHQGASGHRVECRGDRLYQGISFFPLEESESERASLPERDCPELIVGGIPRGLRHV